MHFYLSINLSSFSDVSFKHPDAFKNHVKSKHEEKSESGLAGKTECPICKAIFRKYQLKRHLKQVHDGKKDYKCEYCGNEYFENKRLNGHIKREHDNVRNEKCVQCGKLYFTKEVLHKHVKNIHNKKVNQIEEIVKLFECEFCGKTLRTKQSMQIHVKVVHEGLRDNHVCHICKYLFITVRLNYDLDLN